MEKCLRATNQRVVAFSWKSFCECHQATKKQTERIAKNMATGTKNIKTTIENYRKDQEEALLENETKEKKYSTNEDGTVKFEK